MAGLEDEWRESNSVITRDTAQYSQGRSQFASGNSQNNYQSNWTTQKEWSHGGDSAFENRKEISIPSIMVGRVIGKGGSKIRELINDSKAYIKVGNCRGLRTIITLSGSYEEITKAQELIDKILCQHHASANSYHHASANSHHHALANSHYYASANSHHHASAISHHHAPANSHHHASVNSHHHASANNDSIFINNASSGENNTVFFKLNDHGEEVIDWEIINAFYDNTRNERMANLPPIVKDFYREDPSVSNMSAEEVTDWRHKIFDVQVIRTFADHPDLRPIPNPVLTFEQAFKDYPEILNEICKQGFKEPTPIQSQSWPILLRGEDMIGVAQTNTGKTLSFLLPALIHIDGQTIPREYREGPAVLILVPTRELAYQIHDEVSRYQYKDIKSTCLCRGGDGEDEIETVDIVIATPGRLCNLILARHLHIINFSYIVLDNADRLLDCVGFELQIRKSLFDVRPDQQTVMTSATWPARVSHLANAYMKNPIQVNVGSLGPGPGRGRGQGQGRGFGYPRRH